MCVCVFVIFHIIYVYSGVEIAFCTFLKVLYHGHSVLSIEMCTLKDFKNANNEINNLLTFNVSILLRFGKDKNQYVSKTCFKFDGKIINNVRVIVYQIAIPYDSKVAV